MELIYSIITIAAAILSILSQLRITGQGYLHLMQLSPIRFSLVLLTISAALIVCLTILSRSLRKIPSPKWQRLVQCCIFLSLTLFFLVIEQNFYYDNPSLDRWNAYLHQAVPFFTFCAVLFLLLALCLIENAEDKSIVNIFKDVSYNGRIIGQSVIILITCLILMLAFIPIRKNYYPSHDYGIFAYFGQQILKGKIPYVNMWDHKPPLIFYFNALGLFLGKGSLMGIWVLEVLILWLGAVLLFQVMKKFFPEADSLLVICLGILHYCRLFDFGNYTEEISLFFQLSAAYLFFSEWKNKHPVKEALLSGFLCGLAFTSKQNTIGFWIAAGIISLLMGMENENKHLNIKNRFFSFLAGFLFVNLIWVLYFSVHGAMNAYWDQAFRFNWIYSENIASDRLAAAGTTLTFLPSISFFLLVAFLCWPLWIIYFLSGRKKESCVNKTWKTYAIDYFHQNQLICLAWIDLPVELIMAGLSGMNYQHYFILSVPPACILLCGLLRLLEKKAEKKSGSIRLLLGIAMVIFSFPLIKIFRENYMPRNPSAYTKTASFILENTEKDDPILVWGSRNGIYVMTERNAPTAFFNERPLYLFPAEIQKNQWQIFLNDLKVQSPKFIIYTHETSLPFITKSSADQCIIPLCADYRLPVYQFLCSNYHYRETINQGQNDAWDIYEKNE